ncbi:MAG: DUF7064 domain-containing protein [Acidimicrobiales bacterium]
MTVPAAHAVDPSDEGRHDPGPEELWNESHYADFVTDDGTRGGYVRLGLSPNLGVSWWTVMLVGPDHPTLSWTDYRLPVPLGGALAVATGEAELAVETVRPLEELRVRAAGTGEVLEHPEDVYVGTGGEAVELSLDLTWRTDGSPYHYGLTTRYEIPCQVAGTLRIGTEVVGVGGPGQRDHSWGVRDWWSMAWCWASARLDDGTRVQATDVRLPGRPPFGYVQSDGRVDALTSLDVTEELGPHGLPRSARIAAEPGGIDLEVQPVAFGPLLLEAGDGRRSRFPRAMARYLSADGRVGTGWIEWNQPEGAAAGTNAG